jgi:hypothetical protein
MPDDTPATYHDHFHGLLNLEQQRRRAKDLLKALRAGEGDALRRLAAGTGRGMPAPDAVSLADAQLVIARENGFASWPKLKTHCDRLQEQVRQRKAGRTESPDTEETRHLRCGSDIRQALKVAGFRGAFLEFADPVCQGPVPDLPMDAFLDRRAAFVAAAYGIADADARARMQREYEGLAEALGRQHVVLWFEHDSYDQLILAGVLAFLAAVPAGGRPPKLELICVDHVPGVPGFTGLGQLAPEMLLWLWDNSRQEVTEAQLDVGTVVWAALRAADPSGLVRMASGGTPPIPPMARALDRHLRELPSHKSGLSLTQQLVLRILAEEGPLTGGRLFNALMTRYEPLPFLGDLMFWHVLEDFAASSEDPFTQSGTGEWAGRRLAPTAYGLALLAGEADYMMSYTGERWVGGVRIAPQKEDVPDFRWAQREEGLEIIKR